MTRKSGKTQKALPGLEDRRLEDLHEKSILLYAVRKQRMELTTREVALADEVRILMEKYKKQESGYHIDGVDVEYVLDPAKPKIKVKVEADGEEDETKPSEVTKVSPHDGADFDESQEAASGVH
jgi:hypothetical protein